MRWEQKPGMGLLYKDVYMAGSRADRKLAKQRLADKERAKRELAKKPKPGRKKGPPKPKKKDKNRSKPNLLTVPPRPPIVEAPPEKEGTTSLISIVIPHANRYDNLFVCLDSIAAQTVKPSRVVIADYSKTVQQAKVIPEKYGGKLDVAFVHVKNRPFSRGPAINKGRQFISSPLMFILDADITFNKYGMEHLIAFFGNRPSNKLVSFRGMKMTKGGKKIPNKATFDQVYGAFMVMMTKTFDAVGGHNPMMQNWGYQDVCLRNRLLDYGRATEHVLPQEYIHLYHKNSFNRKTHDRNVRIYERSVWTGKAWKLK
jgi:GT2 family glycosyltransferase